MGERLDLSNASLAPVEEVFLLWQQEWNLLLTEALRAQASEDALKERVRVLEEILKRWSEYESGQIILTQGEELDLLSYTQEALTGGKGEG